MKTTSGSFLHIKEESINKAYNKDMMVKMRNTTSTDEKQYKRISLYVYKKIKKEASIFFAVKSNSSWSELYVSDSLTAIFALIIRM